MNLNELKTKIKNIVKKANKLKNKYIEEKIAPVNYACIFCQSEQEFKELNSCAETFAEIIKETATGPLYKIEPLETVAGKLQLLKIRKPDATRPEEGDADFTIETFEEFENIHLSKNNFKLIKRENMKMIELVDNEFDVRVYFSYPTLEKIYNIN